MYIIYVYIYHAQRDTEGERDEERKKAKKKKREKCTVLILPISVKDTQFSEKLRVARGSQIKGHHVLYFLLLNIFAVSRSVER